MTDERKIEIFMKDGLTKSDAKKYLKNDSIIFEDFEENFNLYMKEWDVEEEDILLYRKMIEEKVPYPGWGIVEDDGQTYYISYYS